MLKQPNPGKLGCKANSGWKESVVAGFEYSQHPLIETLWYGGALNNNFISQMA
jgi:hypothetical protein